MDFMQITSEQIEATLKQAYASHEPFIAVSTVWMRHQLGNHQALLNGAGDVAKSCEFVARVTRQNVFYDVADIVERMAGNVEFETMEELCFFVASTLREAAEQSVNLDKAGATIQ